jgi:hypothetical protein
MATSGRTAAVGVQFHAFEICSDSSNQPEYMFWASVLLHQTHLFSSLGRQNVNIARLGVPPGLGEAVSNLDSHLASRSAPSRHSKNRLALIAERRAKQAVGSNRSPFEG